MWTWKNWLSLAGVIAASILLSFIVQWHITTGWRVFWLDGLIRWWGDFVMFGWVEDYQTLIGGMLALGAGAFVMLSAVYQRHTASMDAIRAGKVQFEENLSRAAVEYRRLLHHIRRDELATARDVLRSYDSTVLALSSKAKPLANWLLRINFLADKHLGRAISEAEFEGALGSAGDDIHKRRAKGYAVMAADYLSSISRLIASDGGYLHAPRPLHEMQERLLSETEIPLEWFGHYEYLVE